MLSKESIDLYITYLLASLPIEVLQILKKIDKHHKIQKSIIIINKLS